MSTYFIDGDTMTGIADAVRDMRHETDLMTPAQIEAKIRATSLGIPIKIANHMVNGQWVRPQEYPDLDSITIPSNFDGMYLTYDLRKTPGYGWIGLYIQLESSSSGKNTYFVERGHLSNGEFVVDAQYEVARNSYFRQALDDTYGDVQLWRIWSNGRILRKGFCPSSATSSVALINQMQPCVECVGKLDYLNNLVGTNTSTSSIAQCTLWMEREKISCAGLKSVASISKTWSGCFSLQQLEIEDWPVDKWAVTIFSSVWTNCYSLEKLDLSKWDTSGWGVTSLADVWNGCRSLKTLNISNWDTSNWAITSLYRTWAHCYSLQYLDISNWDTSDWAVTNMNSCWHNCYSLQNLDLSKWDTSNWAVTDMGFTWYCCYFLKTLDVSTWNTENWSVSNLISTWNSCYSLQNLDLSEWDTSSWVVSSADYTFYDCFSLNQLDLSDWDLSNWTASDFTGFLGDLYSLTSLSLPTGKIFTSTSVIPNFAKIQNFDGVSISVDHSYNTAYSLTIESLNKILAALPTVSSSRTITLANNRHKLTAAELAVATEKGWTIG